MRKFQAHEYNVGKPRDELFRFPGFTHEERTRIMRSWFAVASGLTLAAMLASLTADGGEKAGPKDNMPPAGFTALFNGKDLSGWQGLVPINARKKMSKEQYAGAVEKASEKLSHWNVQDGI